MVTVVETLFKILERPGGFCAEAFSQRTGQAPPTVAAQISDRCLFCRVRLRHFFPYAYGGTFELLL